MPTPAQSYRRAVAVLRPSRARMDALRAQVALERAQADAIVNALIEDGRDLRAEYERLQGCRPAPGKPDPNMILRATIAGRLRRG